MSFDLRRARDTDLPRLIEIGRRAWLGAFGQTAPFALIAWWVRTDRTRTLYEAHWRAMWVADRAGEILGLVHPEDDEINGLWIHPAHQRHGVGRALLAAGEALVRAAGHRRAWLTCSAYNAEALKFYAAVGYVEVARAVVPLPCGGGLEGVDVRLERTLV